jgi:catechol 2,3-dioxygenase-like lactoylglutathione lyase family enzyme
MKFPGILVFLRKGEVGGETMGTSFDHAGFWVPNGKEFQERLRASGVKMDPTAGTRRPEYKGYSWGNVYSPDGVKVEILEDANLALPIEIDHIHLYGSNGVAETDVQAWYHKTFDARVMLDPVPNAAHPVVAGLIANVEFKMTNVPDKLVPMKGRAVEHMGFEVKNLEAFCQKLEANGVKFDKPFSKGKSYASAELSDPWGTVIELTEGLNKF